MSNALRQTQSGYQRQIDQIDRDIVRYQDMVKAAQAKKDDLLKAKAVVDEAVAKLPPPPAPEKAPKSKPAAK